MVLQPRPQGRYWRRRRRYRKHAGFEAEGDRDQANRAPFRRVATESRGTEARRQACRRQPPAAQAVGRYLGRRRLVSGSAPIVPTNSFDSRFGAAK
jgi:hypothetical protein